MEAREQVRALDNNLGDLRESLGVLTEDIVLINILMFLQLALETIKVHVADRQEKTQIVRVFKKERLPLGDCKYLGHNSVQDLSASV